jgi:galactitol-specific phosphotransferase system IIC component
MKLFMLSGAIIGFSLGLALGFAGQAEWSSMLWHACAAAAALGLLARWWGRVWLRGLHVSVLERRAAEIAARQKNQSTTPLKK